mmetsp:Transcript_26122/g.37476  ORF Transcript_26122/g.37476 Transcript_26122/m.37476 type:complete len:224 (+) Transcript_26122:2993-3664(+)
MSKAIACANSIEQALAANADTLNSFINTTHISPVTSLDSIINAISLMNPLPPSISPTTLKRSTKRNVYPILITTTVRFLCGTFNWRVSEHPTSLDLAFNLPPIKNIDPIMTHHCTCNISALSFSLDSTHSCVICGKSQPFIGTASRVHSFNSLQASQASTPNPPLAANRTHGILPKKNLSHHKAQANRLLQILQTAKTPPTIHYPGITPLLVNYSPATPPLSK